MSKQQDKLDFRRRVCLLVAAGGIAAVIGLLNVCTMAPARDLDGRFAASPLKPWFDHLASKKGLCCSFADGYAIEDADWTTKDGHYRVRLPVLQGSSEFEWVDVPDDAVITEPNQAGRTMVWPTYRDGQQTVRCFMPGSMT